MAVWVLQQTDEHIYQGLPRLLYDCMVNDCGARIIAFGRESNGFQTVFIYTHDDVRVCFKAMRRPGKDWIDYSLTGKRENNFALGPNCDVWIDTRSRFSQYRVPSSDELGTIKEQVAEFLIKEFHLCRLAIAPYPQQVSFHLKFGGVLTWPSLTSPRRRNSRRRRTSVGFRHRACATPMMFQTRLSGGSSPSRKRERCNRSRPWQRSARSSSA
jgi:hypothetical protein